MDRDNVAAHWRDLNATIDGAEFVALDLELSGLGPRKAFVTKNLSDRYLALRDVVATRAIQSMGVSCFVPRKAAATYMAYTWDISLFCRQNFTVEPNSLSFLSEHGFDFNAQVSRGIRYNRDNVPRTGRPATPGGVVGSRCAAGAECEDDKYGPRKLFAKILTLRTKPIVLHNGLLDLM